MDDLVSGRLLRRYKRFLADIELDGGEQITAHCPNTGAMTGCAEPGSRVWLSRSDSPKRKYPYTWELVQTARGMACIHSARANKVVRAAFEAGLVPGFEGYPQLRAEVKYGEGSRADLLLEGAGVRVFVEVKCVTLCTGAGQGLFPDAVSERGRKHLRELAAVRDASTRALMFYCVFHEGVHRVSAAGEIDPAYREALAAAMAQGVEVLAWGAVVSPRELRLDHPLPFTLDPPDAG
ncbi:DNA/RNA nuclease SfsA [Mangrovimicrobium sediminis]|uniref:Sugar fermentation stimulation protein homolog n=1 Tax=Mangrovimicrobium sediminis TaxID=2562682 RepID=A0A4Z0LV35_9GAMM|nr:DNA/RNA nuclease SfsA [Haliea sp. SAOS-164]TGD70925.1 DNA/RNA nuclease SfsA [Haliea sp. SAOS-164]